MRADLVAIHTSLKDELAAAETDLAIKKGDLLTAQAIYDVANDRVEAIRDAAERLESGVLEVKAQAQVGSGS
jgi:hypothetical protein